MLKGLADILPGCDSKALYELFPVGPAKQGARSRACRSRWARAGIDGPQDAARRPPEGEHPARDGPAPRVPPYQVREV